MFRDLLHPCLGLQLRVCSKDSVNPVLHNFGYGFINLFELNLVVLHWAAAAVLRVVLDDHGAGKLAHAVEAGFEVLVVEGNPRLRCHATALEHFVEDLRRVLAVALVAV